MGNQAMQRFLHARAAAPATAMPAAVSRVIAGTGVPLPAALRERAEPFFGAALGDIRVHAGPAASRASADLEANAFSLDHHIVLGNAAALTDPRQLAHEIGHALQPRAPTGAQVIGNPGGPAEYEADTAARQFARGAFARTRMRAPRTGLIHRDARHPTATVFDADYRLYALTGTAYDNATQHYYLSPWDRSHLVRVNGLYLLVGSTRTSLITPPEIRQAGGGRGVLVPLTSVDVAVLNAGGRSRAAQFAIEVARRELSVTVSSVTLSSAANQDFTRPVLPAAVGTALGTATVDVDPGQLAGVEAARTRASRATQDRTLSLAATRSEELPMRELTWSDRMDVATLGAMSDADLAGWYVGRLASLQAQLLESAQSHHLPMQLLAAVILNELADIDWSDVMQSGASTYRGSLGVAQIQVDTARTNRLVDLSPGAHRTGWRRSRADAHDVDHPAMVDMGERLRMGQLLQVPQIAIEAAAREVQGLITRMAANHAQPWQVTHGFTATGPQSDAIYAHVGSGDRKSREGALADAVCGAYNSPDVITASDTTRFSNARIHGQNANLLAQDLYRFRLFRTA